MNTSCTKINGLIKPLGYSLRVTKHARERAQDRRVPFIDEALERVYNRKLCEFLYLAATTNNFAIKYALHKDYYLFLGVQDGGHVSVRTVVKHEKGSHQHGMPIIEV